MAIRKIVYYPDPVLRQVGKPVEKFDRDLEALVEDMFETMYDAQGCGLAAPQIGLSLQLTVIDTSRDKSQQLVLANPKIIEKRDPILMEEGCLSVPGAWDKVERCQFVKVRAQNEKGEFFEMEGEGLLAEAFQHEIDHLNGTLYIDHLSLLKKNRAKKKLEKYKKQHGLI